MIGDMEIRGKWFLPSKPRRKISGVLTYTPSDGTSLELDDFLLAGIEEALSILEPEVILGISNSGEHVTLYKCGGTGSSFRVYQFFIGAHFKRPERIKFQYVTLEYLHLHEWVDPQNIETKSTTDPKGFTVTYKDNQSILLAETKEYRISLPEDLVAQHNDHIKAFVDTVVSTRNYLTHHDDKGNAAEGTEIYYLSLWLKMLVEVSLLKEIGFNDGDIKSYLSQSRNYRLVKPMSGN